MLSRLRRGRCGSDWGRLLGTLVVAKGGPDVVGLADEVSVDDAVAIARHEPAVTRDAGEARHVVHGSAIWRLHHELVGRNLMVTGAARSA